MLKRTIRLDGVPSDQEISNAPNCQRVKRLVNESAFGYLFPLANQGKGMGKGPYSYENFLKAVAKWPKFCDDGGPNNGDKDEICIRELSTMFAHFVQEVGAHNPSSQYPQWRQGLYYYREVNPGWNYCSKSPKWVEDRFPCSPGQSYSGRGAKQISYNYNYGPFSVVIYNDTENLLSHPDGVITNEGGWLAFASAIWFDMTPQTPKPSIHDVITGWWKPNSDDLAGNRNPGFGATVMITNGGLECGHASKQADNRVAYYKAFCDYFRISPGEYIDCVAMRAFDAKSSAATQEYWDYADWLSNCRLVSYQAAFSIFEDPADPDVPYCGCMNMYAS
ncbi:Endochitinase 3 precursor, putative [Perkinsus marinus ATCC 50983]|uniref:Endochitinase 3, putative n=1 Tax=Perkinsus marinus (strain ATCC 50983 / TXsc) TaxID=423536 RepID=C5KT12_PERM5|nr:Endochitinase 3 precursor, putative [Perkinsus marinus ATCC 50983]EER12362.1 Endochitinase 3 precursor, putative [Perkinsus marinus ATCC 50983]|eukprot:XP_002780567.1 Endochitinase 3 precursor, putative [Perkinsus marinus ATCC 50983]